MALTDAALRALKPNAAKQKISDSGGLQIWILPSASKVWRFAYRFNGLQKDIALGKYPAVGLAEARKKRDEAKALLASGIDPSQQRKLDCPSSNDLRLFGLWKNGFSGSVCGLIQAALAWWFKRRCLMVSRLILSRSSRMVWPRPK